MKKWCLKVVGGLAVAVMLLNLMLVPGVQAKLSEPWNEPPSRQHQEQQSCGCAQSVDSSTYKVCHSCDFQSGLTLLAPDAPILRNLQVDDQMAAIQSNFGTVLWQNASLHVQKGSQWQIVVVPIAPAGATSDETKVLLAGTQDGTTFHLFVFGMLLEQSTKRVNSAFSGRVTFYESGGGKVATADFVDGEPVAVSVPNQNQVTPLGLNWGCFGDCLLTLGLEVWPICVPACSFCASLPAPYNPGVLDMCGLHWRSGIHLHFGLLGINHKKVRC